jgi:ribosomal protein S12 methylthiotransferase
MVSLCEELAKLGIWVLHYVYPYPHVDDVIPLMAAEILPYLDIPLQHASPRILKLMKRPGSGTVSWRALSSGVKFARI